MLRGMVGHTIMAFQEAMIAYRKMLTQQRTQTGPGQRGLYGLHRGIGTSKYKPHQGQREMARRRRQLERARVRDVIDSVFCTETLATRRAMEPFVSDEIIRRADLLQRRDPELSPKGAILRAVAEARKVEADFTVGVKL